MPSISLYERALAAAAENAQSKVVRARDSVAVIPWRPGRAGSGSEQIEVYWVQRSPRLAFMGGWHAFPGGAVDRTDSSLEEEGWVLGQPQGLDQDSRTAPAPGLSGEQLNRMPPDRVPGLLAAAAREMYEEVGLLPGTGMLPTSGTEPGQRDRGLRELLAEAGSRLDLSRLVYAGRWLTPPLAPRRFDNRFFLLPWDPELDPEPAVDGSELVHGEWLTPGQALERWQRHEVMVAPPVLHTLRVLQDQGPDKGLEQLRNPTAADLGPMRRVEFRPGIVLMPLRTPTLPPATHTNSYLLGFGDCVVVDPATPIPEEIQRLIEALEAAKQQGRQLRALWLTHHHPDHVGAVQVLRRHFEVPVLAHPLSVPGLRQQGIEVDGALEDGQTVTLDGEHSMTVQVLHTPGHTRGHLAFFEPDSRSLIAGDLVAGLSTIVIDPPEGDMDAYLSSLRKAAELEPRTLFPAHGPSILNAMGKLEHYISHRLAREATVLACWQRGLTTAQAMVSEVYTDIPTEVHPIACRQIEAHLQRLRQRGEIPPA